MKYLLYLLATVGILAIGCQSSTSNQKQAENTGPIKVAVTNYPLSYFAKQIATTEYMISFPIPGGGDPAYWNPDNIGLAAFQKAELILINGAGYEKWIEKVSLPQSKIVNTSKSFAAKYIEVSEGSTHSHGPEGEHEHIGYAFTTWLNFKYAATQAHAVKDALAKLLPEQEDTLSIRFDALKEQLAKLDENMAFVAESLGSQTIIGSHPVYQYLAEGYGLNIESVHWEPNEYPTDEQWSEMKHLIDHHEANIMLWEDEPLPEARQQLESLGIKIFIFNPCGNRPEMGDFLSVMKKNIDDLVKEFC